MFHFEVDVIEAVGPVHGEGGADPHLVDEGGRGFEDGLRGLVIIDVEEDGGKAGRDESIGMGLEGDEAVL